MMEERRNSLVQWFLKNPSARTFIFQFLSTIFLTFMCLSTVNLPPFQGHLHDPNPFHMITVALVVYSIICFSGPISGAHINPAVTLAVYSSKKLQKGDWKIILSYVVGQISGCTLGCIFSKMFFDQGGPVYMEFPEGLDLLKDCTQEFIGTFLLIMFSLIMSNEETSFVHSEAWVHLLIGVVYYYCLTYATHLHFLNPAIQFSFQLQGMMFIDGIEANTLLACLYLAFAQCLGAWVSQYVFHKKYLKQAKFWKDQFSGNWVVGVSYSSLQLLEMSLSSTLNASQTLNTSQKMAQKTESNFFAKLDALSSDLKQVADRLQDLQQETSSIREQKTSVQRYLQKKSEQNRLRLMGELELFEIQVRKKIDEARRETQKIDERVEKIKEAQLYSLQMILSIQRRVQQLEVQLGVQQELE